ncbi:hypothetical protein B4123_2642 [Bacillus paralicheniformis]|nr:hypothetical protein B4123_2642 [Bacillus paralicheniformis]PRS18570.1 hypothetical protein C6W27_01500 [Bacillus paralicheniformis]TWJ49417.1 hypothetical protein CHCC5023_1600 [Bacillus paralicheniformis]TWJ77371.1 hypothetical protein CHCC5019_2847 [Bacillus paralicheniformis]
MKKNLFTLGKFFMAGKWYTIEEKLNILSECDQGSASVKEIAGKYGVHVLNHDRLQEKLNGLSPAEYRAKAV